jgi:hypothetical protein
MYYNYNKLESVTIISSYDQYVSNKSIYYSEPRLYSLWHVTTKRIDLLLGNDRDLSSY